MKTKGEEKSREKDAFEPPMAWFEREEMPGLLSRTRAPIA